MASNEKACVKMVNTTTATKSNSDPPILTSVIALKAAVIADQALPGGVTRSKTAPRLNTKSSDNTSAAEGSQALSESWLRTRATNWDRVSVALLELSSSTAGLATVVGACPSDMSH